MSVPRSSGIDNKLASLRRQRGFSAAQVAKDAGVSRQTIYAIEAGSYIPNTLLALKLAKILDASVEDLFSLEEGPGEAPLIEQAMLLPQGAAPQPGQPVQLCRVEKRLVASVPAAVPWYFPASDAVVAGESGTGKTKVQLFHPDVDSPPRLLVAGCDPGISVLSRHVRAAGLELVLAHRNSSQALELLKAGCIHVAGTHLRDEASGESNLPEIGRQFPKTSIAVITFAVWEEGIVTARGNPKEIRGVEDLARPDIAIVNREPGAGSRVLLDRHLQKLGISGRKVRGYEDYAPGHLPAAFLVQSGKADCCIATRGAARVFGLGFVPLVAERYDLAIRKRHLDLPAVQTLLDTLSRSSFRRELETLGGYDTKAAGTRLL